MECTPENIAATKIKLAEAELAYHNLNIGQAIAEVRDQNGENVKFTRANKSDLYSYILFLQGELSKCSTEPVALKNTRGPVGFLFKG